MSDVFAVILVHLTFRKGKGLLPAAFGAVALLPIIFFMQHLHGVAVPVAPLLFFLQHLCA